MMRRLTSAPKPCARVSAMAKTVGFQGGRIVAVPGAGTFEVYDVLDSAYARAGDETGVLGLPVEQQQLLVDGRYQRFQTGRISVTGGVGFFTRGPIAGRYVETGAEVGALGYPTTDEYLSSPGVRRNDFQHGSISYDEATGQVTVSS